MELKEKIYPVLSEPQIQPNAPPSNEIEMGDSGQTFRLTKITEIQSKLEEEIQIRDKLCKKYLTTSKIVDNVEAGVTVVAIGAGAGGIGLLSTVVAIPVVIALEAVALVLGVVGVASKFAVRKTRTKSEKHLQIKVLAESKLNSINSLISKAIADNRIDHEEFILILGEYEKFKEMKEAIRSKTKKQVEKVNEESLIEKGRQEARESFRALLERNRQP